MYKIVFDLGQKYHQCSQQRKYKFDCFLKEFKTDKIVSVKDLYSYRMYALNVMETLVSKLIFIPDLKMS